ncbi:MAG TPA: aldose 1-epimerase [Rhizobacter sp.]
MPPNSRAHVVELQAGALRLAVRPDLGGCVAGLWHGDSAVLLSSPPASLRASRPSGSFPLVPYSNRIGHRRFEWLGRHHTTEPNFGDSPHSLHGVAWLRPWQVDAVDEHALTLSYEHRPDAHWPFAFHVQQGFELNGEALTVRLVLHNTATDTQPVGLGWHPYFPKRPSSHLRARAAERWDSDASQLPTRPVPAGNIDDDIERLRLDHCFDHWDGLAKIQDDHFSLTLRSSLRRLVVYTPQDKDYFCVEPVSHVNNAIQMAAPTAHGLIALAPGDSTDAWMTLDVTAL